MSQMQIGRFNRPIEVQRKIESRNSLNENVGTWTKIMTWFADKRSVRGNEALTFGGRHSLETVKFTGHYTDSIQLTDRLVHDGVIYNIVYRQECGFREGLTLIAEREAPGNG